MRLDVSASPDPTERLEFEAAALMVEHPPRLRDANKQIVFDITCRPDDVHRGTLGYSRWAAMGLPADVDLMAVLDIVVGRDGYFDYAPVPGLADALEWHMNFADAQLFHFYGSSLFAQDEMQVAEHPALGALREAIEASGHRAVTVDQGAATPVLVTGVERRCQIATSANAAEGRPDGLYGNAFAKAKPEAVTRATTRLEPPTITNFIAMAAPRPGHGRYRAEEIESILVTAYTGFRAAAVESRRLRGVDTSVVVHTGYWGCGAFGGDRVLMILLQVIAARMAGLDRVVIHTGGPDGRAPLAEALRILDKDLRTDTDWPTDDLIKRVDQMAFTWGLGNGS